MRVATEREPRVLRFRDQSGFTKRVEILPSFASKATWAATWAKAVTTTDGGVLVVTDPLRSHRLNFAEERRLQSVLARLHAFDWYDAHSYLLIHGHLEVARLAPWSRAVLTRDDVTAMATAIEGLSAGNGRARFTVSLSMFPTDDVPQDDLEGMLDQDSILLVSPWRVGMVREALHRAGWSEQVR